MGLHREDKMMKWVVLALFATAVFAQEDPADEIDESAGPTGKPKEVIAGAVVSKLRANARCAGEMCEPAKWSCDPTVGGDCEEEMLPPAQITCDSIQHCGPCTLHLHCGYINSKNKCVNGYAAGPKDPALTVAPGDWDFAYCSKDVTILKGTAVVAAFGSAYTSDWRSTGTCVIL